MEPIWLKHYPRGVPAEVDVSRFASLTDMLEQSCGRFRERAAFTNLGVSLSYGDLDRLSRDFGVCLQQFGLPKGERVAIMLPNLLQYPVALFGALRAGLVVVNVNPQYTARELQHQLADSGAAAVVVLENFAHTLQQVVAATAVRHIVTTQAGDLLPPVKACLVNFAVKWIERMVPRWRLPGATAFNAALRLGARHTLSDVPLAHADIAFLQYTGGTSGVAKGAILTHGNLLANVEQTSAWIGGTLKEGEEVIVTPLPLYHAFALTANLLTFVRWGANDVLITDPRDIRRFVRELRKTRFTVISGVNTLFRMLLDDPGFERVKRANAGALKLAVAGGMSVQRAVAERWQRIMGVPLIEGYGLTEASPIVCANPLDTKAFSGRIGMPIPATRVAIRDETGRELAVGEIGEICVQGPQVMRGYWNMPAETADVLGADGWLRTGDIGVMDERGAIRFIDRRKDVIVVSGFKVYPAEVEDVVMLHPGVKEVGVVGVPDEMSGEAVKAYLVKRDPALAAAAVIAHCRANLTGYKVPKFVEFRDRLPKSAIGKILRRKLKEAHAARDGDAGTESSQAQVTAPAGGMLSWRHADPRLKALGLLLLGVALAGLAWTLPRLPQPPQYHDFADRRACFGLPNCGDTASNALFVLAGAAGLRWLFRPAVRRAFIELGEALPYALFFFATVLVGFASGYYHLAPDNGGLAWDRAAIALAFMAWFAAVLCERVGPTAGLRLLPPLVAAALGSVAYWSWSEAHGVGDLRAYGLVQLYPLLLLPLLLWLYSPRYSGDRDILAVIGLYLLALLCDFTDRPIFALTGGLFSGHTAKHATAALAAYWVVLRLSRRRIL